MTHDKELVIKLNGIPEPSLSYGFVSCSYLCHFLIWQLAYWTCKVPCFQKKEASVFWLLSTRWHSYGVSFFYDFTILFWSWNKIYKWFCHKWNWHWYFNLYIILQLEELKNMKYGAPWNWNNGCWHCKCVVQHVCLRKKKGCLKHCWVVENRIFSC